MNYKMYKKRTGNPSFQLQFKEEKTLFFCFFLTPRIKFKILKPSCTSIGRTVHITCISQYMIWLFIKSKDEFGEIGFLLGVKNVNFLLHFVLFDSLDEISISKIYCTSFEQLLLYPTRWHSFCINCKKSSGNQILLTKNVIFWPTGPRS